MKKNQVKKTSAILLSALACSLGTAAAKPKSLSVSYQNYRHNHNYTKRNLASDLVNMTSSGNFGDGNQRVVTDPPRSGYKRLRFDFDRNTSGSKDHYLSATSLADSNKYTLEYRVKFLDNWKFGRGDNLNGGGKLPGLAGGTHPAGGRPDNTGMTSRVMWREDKQRPNGSTRKYLECYHYWLGQFQKYDSAAPDQKNRFKFGDRTHLLDARKNTWYAIGMQVKLNKGNRVGRLTIKVNGVTEYNREHRFLTSRANWKMNRYAHNFFYGGSGINWAPKQNTSLLFDNLRVKQGDL